MPVQGLPDPKLHKLCYSCRKWHEPGEGEMFIPDTSDLFEALWGLGRAKADDAPEIRFLCRRCSRISWIATIVVFGILAVLVVFFFVLARWGPIGQGR